MHTLSKTIILWDVILQLFAIIFAIIIIIKVVNDAKFRKCVKAFNHANYDAVLKNDKLFNLYRTPQHQDTLHFMFAVAYLEKGFDWLFLKHIQQVKGEKLAGRKNYWLAVYALWGKEFEKFEFFRRQYEFTTKTEERVLLDEILSLAYQCQKNGYVLTAEETVKISKIQSRRIQKLFGCNHL